MLRITELSRSFLGRSFKLEGKLLGPWVEELRHICSEPLDRLEPIRLDLVAVTFVDAAGAKLLRELIHQGTRITPCSGFVAALLHVEET